MALFSKPPAKKPEGAPKPEPKPRHAPAQPASARQLVKPTGAAREVGKPRAKSTNVVEMAPAKAAIELEHVGNGLCAVLENAALLFASNQAQAARALLDDGVNQDDEARTSSLAWLALFDLLRRAGDKRCLRQARPAVRGADSSAPRRAGRSWAVRGPASDPRRRAATSPSAAS